MDQMEGSVCTSMGEDEPVTPSQIDKRLQIHSQNLPFFKLSSNSDSGKKSISVKMAMIFIQSISSTPLSG